MKVIVLRYSFKDKDRSLPLFVDSIGYNWLQESVNRQRGYPYVHWLQTYSGTGIITIENEEIELKSGMGILINQDIPHRYTATSSEWRTGYFTFGGALISEITKVLGFNDYLLVQKPDATLIKFISKYHTMFNQDNIDLYDSSSLVYKFLLLIKKYRIKNPTNYQLNKKIIIPILDYIHCHYQEPVDNQDFVRLTNYSLQYILEVFRNNHGVSPHQVLIDYRILKSKELLLNNPELSIEEIGHQVGFKTNSYFIAMFKRNEKVTPGKFRSFYK
ncbi:AraC family transcriptional regulator [Pediococcus acidilactici]|uniref:AraC family transcriptional regulator n=1 Tax=Pediococcus acidilactici TaxID=1254 RepID=UPI002AFEAEFF|nr:helix-turn-helix transcriptional regulator [Pediococcus acidilactici]WQS11752.1 helix-turn-helix transcriptional regulator [Pediococcus acidilactici]